jgi:TPR repeat protein
MPKLEIVAELREIYQYPPSPKVPFSLKHKIVIATNICRVIDAVHKAGYVFGDFNPQNIAISSRGHVAFLDVDSYHFTDDSSGKTYRCNVCADGYAAPELLEHCADHAANFPADSKGLYAKTPLPTFTKETDYFALSIHIFKLLMNGYTPFGGIIESVSPSKASPAVGNAAIRRNEYCFRPGYKPLSAAIPPLSVFPQEIEDLFTRSFFVIQTPNPQERPSPREWYEVLRLYHRRLIQCSQDPLHYYDGKNSTCPFCEADRKFTLQSGVQVRPITKKRSSISTSDSGDKNFQNWLTKMAGYMLLSLVKDGDKNFQDLVTKAEKGNADARINLGKLYYHGIGVAKDEKKAVEWFMKAAEQGNAVAQYNLGNCYRNGIGVAADEKTAVGWFTKAAEQGNAVAQYNLGNCYSNGIGVEIDKKKAISLYTKSAEQGHAYAQNNLGWCYWHGFGVAKDAKKAVYWYTKAAEQGNADAQYILGWCYQYGIGVEIDKKKAISWYKKAVEQGDAYAQYQLKSLKRTTSVH